MPSVRYTRIEITPDAYRSLEAEAILQGKTLKKLASELILKGVSKKALDFVQELEEPAVTSKPQMDFNEEMTRVIRKIGATGIHISLQTLKVVKDSILEEGYQGAMLYVAQHTASMERDELHRVIAICRRYKLSEKSAAYLVENLNEIESGNWI
ncbi:MAG TPA: hypothetical protein PKY20_02345 [Methanothrix sp.]|jgi:hypothetical protein|nr:hypothetical protein [Methanothrix sp.]HOU70272.1 hypothetical protein [Methanothrix sp.]HQE97012.1 hypothetical protein [Methanothrix sp.]HQJ79476.1 hypothetical protein [Methanothrix sp.]HUM80281.1 hypothetical protein [Methanothrix sp.]